MKSSDECLVNAESVQDIWDDITDMDLLEMQFQEDSHKTCQKKSPDAGRKYASVSQTSTENKDKHEDDGNAEPMNKRPRTKPFYSENYSDDDFTKCCNNGGSRDKVSVSTSISKEDQLKDDQLKESKPTGDQPKGDQPKGAQPKGDHPKDQPTWDHPKDQPKEDQLKGDRPKDQPKIVQSKRDLLQGYQSKGNTPNDDLLTGGLDKHWPSTSITNLMASMQKEMFTPFQLFRGKYLCVTDLTSQAWCEQALVYSFTKVIPVELVDTTVIDTGSSIHLARELEVHDISTIKVTSNEDKFAVKLLNILTSINALTEGTHTIRELPIFGELPNSSMFVIGIIDEIKYNDKGELELNELKSRKIEREPSRAQFMTHSLQVMVYKHLFDSLIKGMLHRDKVLSHMCLDPDTLLGKEIVEHGHKVGLQCSRFGDLLDITLLKFQFSDLPLIDSLNIEYCYQATGASFAITTVEMDTDWLIKTLEHYLKFWNGDRDVEGVDIEDVWKCRMCPYSVDCEWIEMKTRELTIKNKLNSSIK